MFMATKIAHAYPGQGAQFPEMGNYLSKKALQIASESFQKLIDALKEQNDEVLTETAFVQPAVYLVEASLMEKLPSPSLVLGHSSGEYAALVEARVWDVRTGFEIIRARGHFSASFAPKGFMVQVPSSSRQQLLSEFKSVYLAAINSEDRVVVAGIEADWEKVKAFLEENQVDYRLLPVSAPFHTPYMEKAAQRLRSFLEINPGKMPAVPVYLNALRRVVNSYDDVIEGLTLGLTKSIDWLEAQEYLKKNQISTLVEIYPRPYISKFTAFPTYNVLEFYQLTL